MQQQVTNTAEEATIITHKQDFKDDFDTMQRLLDNYWQLYDDAHLKCLPKLRDLQECSKNVDKDIDGIMSEFKELLDAQYPPGGRTFFRLFSLYDIRTRLLQDSLKMSEKMERKLKACTVSLNNYNEMTRTCLMFQVFDCTEQMRYPISLNIRKLDMDMVKWDKVILGDNFDLNVRVPEFKKIEDEEECFSIEENLDPESSVEEEIDPVMDSESTKEDSTSEAVDEKENPPGSPDLTIHSPPNSPAYPPVSPAYEAPEPIVDERPEELPQDDQPPMKKRKFEKK